MSERNGLERGWLSSKKMEMILHYSSPGKLILHCSLPVGENHKHMIVEKSGSSLRPRDIQQEGLFLVLIIL